MKITPIVLKDISYKAFSKPQNSITPSAFAEFEKDRFVAQPKPIAQNKNKFDKNKLILGLGIATVIAFGASMLLKKKMNIEDVKSSVSKLDELFPNDVKYRNKIAQAIGLDVKDSHKLASIVGCEELTKVAKDFEQVSEIYSPGKVQYTIFDSVEKFDNSNVTNGLFGANFHLHTDNSDGKLTVKELLDKCVQYADERFRKTNKPFYLAITDHDTVNGCKEAVEIISKEPEKFKNLKLILGIENTFVYKNPEILNDDVQMHILSYGINPFSKQFDDIIGVKMQKNIENIKGAISHVNDEFKSILSKNDVGYSFEDMTKISKALGVSIKNATYYMKDYLQFKYIFAKKVLKNSDLCTELTKAGVDLKEIDYAKPIKMITKNPDYSKGQKYYEYYFDAVKDYVSTLGDNSNSSRIKSLFEDFSSEDRAFLQKIEEQVLDEKSLMFVKANEFFSFDEGITKLSNLDDGVIGMAHPGVFFPMTALKDRGKLPEMYEDLYRIFSKNGGDKAIFAEDNYQAYYRTNHDEVYAKLKDISSKYGLIKTGGLDTHSKDIFSV